MSPIEISGLPLVRAINGGSPTKSRPLGLSLTLLARADKPATAFPPYRPAGFWIIQSFLFLTLTRWAGQTRESYHLVTFLPPNRALRACGYRKSYPGWRGCRDGLSS